MIPFLADENFNWRIVRGLRRRLADIDVKSAADVGLIQASDGTVLEWAAENNRVVLSHDVNTLAGVAWERVGQGLPLTGVIFAGRNVGIGAAIDDLCLIAGCFEPHEIRGQIWFLPL
jgi:hypothetical protein